MMIQRIKPFWSLLAIGLLCAFISSAQSATNALPDTNSVNAEMQTAIHQVEAIVNQVVPAYHEKPGMHVGRYDYWFHPGAATPKFGTVDVRASQELPYSKFQYVASDLNPGLVFIGSQLEFNAMTKYFYTNRSLPKKRLTEAEMIEINRLYRVIGHCKHQLLEVEIRGGGKDPAASEAGQDGEQPESATAPAKRPRLLNPYIGGGALVFLIAVLLLFSRGRGR
jgi:hypothetical protein